MNILLPDDDIQVGDKVVFQEPGYPLTGVMGEVIAERPFSLTVRFHGQEGIYDISTWRRAFFIRQHVSCGAV